MSSTAGVLIYAVAFALVIWRLSRWYILLRHSATVLKIVGNDGDDFSTFPAGVVEQTLQYPHPGGIEEPCRKLIPAGSQRRTAFIVLHGASPFGENHPAINKLAYALTLIGKTVYIPRLPRLKALHIDDETTEAIAACYRHIVAADGWGDGQVSLIGTSFAGGLLLKATGAEPWGTVRPGAIMTFGTYCDLEVALRFVLTGKAEYGRDRIETTPDPWGQIAFFHNYLDHFERPFDKQVLRLALDHFIAGDEAEGQRALAQLPDRERQLLETMLSPSSSAALELAEEILDHARPMLESLSPASFAKSIRGKVWILHGRQDNSIPYTEALALKAKLGRHAVLNIAGHYGHNPTEKGSSLWHQVRHAFGMLIFLARFLKAAEK